MRTALDKTDLNNEWVKMLWERRGFNRATLVVAEKNVRIIWTALRTGELYRSAF